MDNAVSQLIRLRDTKGAIAKQRVISENRDDPRFTKMLFYALNSRLRYGVSEATFRLIMRNPANLDGISHNYTDIFDVCVDLAAKEAVSNAKLLEVCAFLRQCASEEQQLYMKLLAKTLRLGVTAKSVNKVIPDLIPEWEVQQAFTIEQHPLKDGEWFCVTQKLNGVRATFHNGALVGRSGSVYSGLSHITDRLAAFGDLVFDGELTLLDKGGLSDNEAFRTATGILNSDAPSKANIRFTIFDVISAAEFECGYSVPTYRQRRKQLDELILSFADTDCIEVLPALYTGTDQSVIPRLLDRMVAEDKEGLMINLDVPYVCRRHAGILKVKRFYTMDLPIISCVEGTGRLSGTLGSLIVDFEGTEVGVGSGFTDEQRSGLWNHRDEIKGMLAEVKYKEVSYDKSTGKRSLQFPVFVSLRTDKSEVSFW